jgi:hypothetical protein
MANALPLFQHTLFSGTVLTLEIERQAAAFICLLLTAHLWPSLVVATDPRGSIHGEKSASWLGNIPSGKNRDLN